MTKRPNKNAPQELSAKQPVSVLRQVVAPLRAKPHDPRFDRNMGHYNEDLCKKSYGFIQEQRQWERVELEKTLRTSKDPQQKDAIRRALDRMKSREQTQIQQGRLKEILRERRKVEAELVEQTGKQPFFLKQRHIKDLVLVDRLKQRKAKSDSVDIDKLTEKHRSRKASKQRRNLPTQ